MKPARIVATALIATAALVSGCANTGSEEPLSSSSSFEYEPTVPHGEIESIEMERGNIDQAGTVGDDTTDANETAKTDSQPETYRIRVKLDNGQHVTMTQPLVSDLRVGDRVSIENEHITRE